MISLTAACMATVKRSIPYLSAGRVNNATQLLSNASCNFHVFCGLLINTLTSE